MAIAASPTSCSASVSVEMPFPLPARHSSLSRGARDFLKLLPDLILILGFEDCFPEACNDVGSAAQAMFASCGDCALEIACLDGLDDFPVLGPLLLDAMVGVTHH